MGRGAVGGDVECGHLARAWKSVSQGPVYIIEHTSPTFFKKMFELLTSMSTSNSGEKEYLCRGLKASRLKFETISADVQKFKISLRAIRAFQPTGTMEGQNLSMVIALHTVKKATITYEAKDLYHSTWNKHIAYEELKALPNYSLIDDRTVIDIQSEYSDSSPLTTVVALHCLPKIR